MSATIEPTSTGVVIHMEPPKPEMSQTAGTGSAVCTITSSSSPACIVSSSTSSSSTTKMSMSTSSTKTTKITKTTSSKTSYSTKSSSSTTVTKSSGGSTSSSTYKTITTSSSGSSFSDNLANMLGIDAGKEMERLQSLVSEQMAKMHSEMFTLRSIQGSEAPESSVVKLDKSTIMDYVDKNNSDNLRFNFDMGQYSSESVHVKTIGNQIEVHAQRKTKSADGETCEEYSRTYEMPTNAEICPEKVTSSMFKEGVLTVQLPVSEAIEGQ